MELKDFKKALEYAKDRMGNKSRELNKINVFPVADGDTGTNMSYTISYALDNIDSKVSDQDFFKKVSENVLIGARGNSGSLFSQVIREICDECRSVTSGLSSEKFLSALEKANIEMRKMLQSPQEGTMITVIRMANEAVASLKLNDLSVVDFFNEYVREAKKALEKTPDFLDILKKHNVVDSGAKGFVYFMESIAMALKGDKFKEDLVQDNENNHEIEEIHDLDSFTFRYCTEFVLKNDDFNRKEFRQYLQDQGDSLIFIEKEDTLKVHIHTDTPDNLFKYIENHGKTIFTKKDDMLEQVSNKQKTQLCVVDLEKKYESIFKKEGLFNFIEIKDLDTWNAKSKKNTLFLPASQDALNKLSLVEDVFFNNTSSVSDVLYSNRSRMMNQSVEELSSLMNNDFKEASFDGEFNSVDELRKEILSFQDEELDFVSIFYSDIALSEKLEELREELDEIEMSFSFIEDNSMPIYTLFEK